MLEKIKAAWRDPWTVAWAGAKLVAGAAIVAFNGAVDLLGDPNVQIGVKAFIPEEKWGLFLMAVAIVTYVSAAHRKKGSAS